MNVNDYNKIARPYGTGERLEEIQQGAPMRKQQTGAPTQPEAEAAMPVQAQPSSVQPMTVEQNAPASVNIAGFKPPKVSLFLDYTKRLSKYQNEPAIANFLKLLGEEAVREVHGD